MSALPPVRQVLATVPLFEGLPEADLTRLEELGSVLDLPAQTPVFLQGQPGDRMYVVLSGRVRIYADLPSGARTLAIRKRFEVIGEMALLDDQPRTASGVALSQCRLFAIPREGFEALMHSAPSITFAILKAVAARARAALQREQTLVGELTRANRQLAKFNSRLERRVKETTRELRQANRQLKDLTHRDGLTGVYNRRYFQETLDSVLEEAAGRPASLVLLDVDHFKNVNDTHGHQAGDRVLIGVARTVEASLGKAGVLARYGGEEFVVILKMGKQAAARRAETMRSAVEAQVFQLRGAQPGDVRISLGVASFPEDASTSATLIHAADLALYRAKETGRNRVVAYTADLLSPA